jgi:uncharacterized protein (TIGR03435 family)
MKIEKKALCVFVSAAIALAQTTRPSFEVASIKRAAPTSDENLSVGMSRDPGRLSYNNTTLKNLIAHAYRVKEHQVLGPDWLDSERYDVDAKLPDGASIDQVPSMLQALLVERFKLHLEKTTRIMPAYALVISKRGSKLHWVDEDPGDLRMAIDSNGRHVVGKVSLEVFCRELSTWMDRPVVDMTGLKGVFDLDIRWSGDEGPSDLSAVRPRLDGSQTVPADDGNTGMSLAASIQKQFGLRLENRKARVEVWIVQHAERAPTVN